MFLRGKAAMPPRYELSFSRNQINPQGRLFTAVLGDFLLPLNRPEIAFDPSLTRDKDKNGTNRVKSSIHGDCEVINLSEDQQNEKDNY